MYRISLVTAVLIAVVARGQDTDANKADLKKLQGTWVIESATFNGNPLQEKGGLLTFDKDKMRIAPPTGKGGEEGMFKIDATKKPKTIVFTPKDPKKAATAPKMVYEFDGEILKVVLASPTANPTEVSDKGQTLWTLKRQKK